MNLFDALVSIFVMIVLIGMVAQINYDGNVRVEQRLVAENMLVLADAAKLYARKHNATLAASASATAGPKIELSDLRSEGLIRQNFSDTNMWDQQYNIYVRSPSSGGELLRVIIVTSGGPSRRKKFNNTIVPRAAALIGAPGGYTPTGDIPSIPAGSMYGAGNNWNIPFASVGIPNPGPGHLVYVSDYDTSDLAGEFLYRVEVPGNPELNVMRTELDMSSHGIENVKEVQFVERSIGSETCSDPDDQGRMFLDRELGMYLCRNGQFEMISDTGNSMPIKEVSVVSSGDLIDKPLCAPNTGTVPRIYVAPSIAEAGPEAPAISSFQAWSESVSETQWQVFLRVLLGDKALALALNGGIDTGGWVTPDPNYNRLLVITSCGKETIATP